MCGKLLSVWDLPESLPVGGKNIPINWDFRVILEVFAVFDRPDLPAFAKWRKALRLFYGEEILPQQRQEAMEQMGAFISCGAEAEPGPRLIHWQQDGPLIIAAVNQAAGREIRREQVHWWTFLGYFHAIAPGTLSQVVAIRQKLRSGTPLDAGEQEFMNRNRQLIQLPDPPEVQQEKARLEQLLKGGIHDN